MGVARSRLGYGILAAAMRTRVPFHRASSRGTSAALAAPPSPSPSLPPHVPGSLEAVRVHDDRDAHHAALAIGARAFTVGRDIYFGPGRYAPLTPAGQQLLGHELLHVAAGDHGPCRDPMTKEEIDAEIAKLDQQAATADPKDVDALFKEREQLLALRVTAPSGKAAQPPTAARPAPDISAMIAQLGGGDPFAQLGAGAKKTKKSYGPDNPPGLGTGAAAAAAGESIEAAANLDKTHWTDTTLAEFIDDYIAYAQQDPARKQLADEAIAARPRLLAQLHPDNSVVVAALASYEQAHPEAKLKYQPIPAPKHKVVDPFAPPSLSGGAAAAASGKSLVEALNMAVTHWPEDQLRTFMDEYIAYAKGHPELTKQYADAVAYRTEHFRQLDRKEQLDEFQRAVDEVEKQQYIASGAEEAKLRNFQVHEPVGIEMGEMPGAAMWVHEWYKPAGEALDAVLKATPFVDIAVLALEAYRGKTLVMNEDVDDVDRIMDVLLLGIASAGTLLRAGKTGAEAAAEIATTTGQSLRSVAARIVLLQSLETELPALRGALAAAKEGRALTSVEVAAVEKLETTLGHGGAKPPTWFNGLEKAAADEPKVTVKLGGEAKATSPVVPKGMSLGELAEAAALKPSRPNATLLGEKVGGYDAVIGGTKKVVSEVEKLDKAGQKIIVREVIIEAPEDAIQIKTLSGLTAEGLPSKTPIEKLVADNVRVAINKAYNQPRTAARALTPLPGTNIFERANVVAPKKITIIIQVPGEVTDAMRAAARKVLADHGAVAELAPIEVIVQTAQ